MDERAFRRALRLIEIARTCPPLSGAEICTSGREERCGGRPLGRGAASCLARSRIPARLLVHAWMPLACRVGARFQLCQHEGCPRGLDKRRATSQGEAEKLSRAASSNSPSFPSPRDTSRRELRAQTRQLGSCASGTRAWTRERAGHVTSLGTEPLPDPIGGHRGALHDLRSKFPPPSPDNSGGHGLATSANRRARRKASSFMYACRSRILSRSGLSPFPRK
jgi:hypothetical protein